MSSAITQLEAVSELGDEDRPTLEKRALEATLYFHEQRLKVLHAQHERVSIGSHARNDFHLECGGERSFPVIHRVEGTWVVQWRDAMRVFVRLADGTCLDQTNLEDRKLVMTGTRHGETIHRYAIGLHDCVAVVVDEAVLLFRFVAPLPLPKIGRTSGGPFGRYFVLSFLLHFVLLFALLTSPLPERELDEWLEHQDRFARLILEAPKEPEEALPVPDRADAPSEPEQPARGEKRVSRPPDVQSATPDEKRQRALSAGLLAALGGLTPDINQPRVTTGVNQGGGQASGRAIVGDTQGESEIALGVSGVGDVLGDLSGIGSVRITQRQGRGFREDPGAPSRRGLSQRQIYAVLRRLRPQFRYCYEEELQTLPTLEGKVTAGFDIDGQGKVSAVRWLEDTLGTPAVLVCVERVLRRATFPDSDAAVTSVRYPFIFRPRDAP